VQAEVECQLALLAQALRFLTAQSPLEPVSAALTVRFGASKFQGNSVQALLKSPSPWAAWAHLGSFSADSALLQGPQEQQCSLEGPSAKETLRGQEGNLGCTRGECAS